MEQLHMQGINCIQKLQYTFKDYSEWMLVLSHLGDPRNAFLVYFPLTYFIHNSIGKRVLWVAVVAEWLNALFKSLLHGERPYWWVGEAPVYGNASRPTLQQFKLTCETGPGSPSGHAMVTSSVLYILVSEFLYYGNIRSNAIRIMSWVVFSAVMVAVNLSRCFIATHFPHQVIAGVIAGILIGRLFNSISTSSLTLKHYVAMAVTIIVVTMATNAALTVVGFDPLWSMVKAKRWCADIRWVSMDTTLFYSIIRDSASLLGVGIGLFVLQRPDDSNHSLSNRIVHTVLALVIGRIMDTYKLPHDPPLLFYFLSFTKFTFFSLAIVNIIPRLNLFPNTSAVHPNTSAVHLERKKMS